MVTKNQFIFDKISVSVFENIRLNQPHTFHLALTSLGIKKSTHKIVRSILGLSGGKTKIIDSFLAEKLERSKDMAFDAFI